MNLARSLGFGGKQPAVATSTAVVQGDDELVAAVAASLAFEGFNTVKVRDQILNTIPYKVILIFLTAYVMAGNALSKRVTANRVANKDEADKILGYMRQYKILLKAKKATDITLPRMAICLPAVVVAIRHRVPVVSRLTTSTPWELQDLCFNGYAETVLASGCDDFVRKMSVVLNSAANLKLKADEKVSEEVAMRKLMNFRELSKSAMTSDLVGSAACSKLVLKADSVESVALRYGMAPTRVLIESEGKAPTPVISFPVPRPPVAQPVVTTEEALELAEEPEEPEQEQEVEEPAQEEESASSSAPQEKPPSTAASGKAFKKGGQ